jgi:ribonuclease HII
MATALKLRDYPDLSLEREAGERVVGLDEAGRGPWAGPVVAAAVMFDPGGPPARLCKRITDSKQLSAVERAALYPEILACAATAAVGVASVAEIDSINILQASLLAMRRAVAGLRHAPAVALVDGNQAPRLACTVRTVVGGDGLSLSIAAASILAKVRRDRLMAALAEHHPGYGWERNFGYGTAQHRSGLQRFGVTPHHRRSFRPIRMFTEESIESNA